MDAHVKIAALVCKAWNAAFKEWVPRGIAQASHGAWGIALRDGLALCQYTEYEHTAAHATRRIPYMPVFGWLPRKTEVRWRLFLHGKALATLTLVRQRENADDPEVHEFQVDYQAHRAPRAAHPARDTDHRRLYMAVPHACWTQDGNWACAGGSAVQRWQREKAQTLETWVLEQHTTITRD